MNFDTIWQSLSTSAAVAAVAFVAALFLLSRLFDAVRRWYEANPTNRVAWVLEFLCSVATGSPVPERPGGKRI